MHQLRATFLLLAAIAANLCAARAEGQTKPQRSTAPEFKPGQFDGVFFADVKSVLKGELPGQQVQSLAASNQTQAGSKQASAGSATASESAAAGAREQLMSSGGVSWHLLISPIALEDLVKGSKLKLDQIVTTPAAFAGGGYDEARREFSLLALLFAIIETHPGEVRWKNSAAVARESFARVAANTKVGSRQVYDEAKKRLLDLEDLINGSQLSGNAKSDIEWSQLIDRVPIMQLLEWAQQDFISPHSADEAKFAANLEELQRYAELVAVLGQISLQTEMPDADDTDYQALAQDTITQARQISLAVQTSNAERARQANGKLGQSCTNCHDNFR